MPVEIGEMNTRVELRSAPSTKEPPGRAGLAPRREREFTDRVDQALKQQLRALLRELD